MTRTPLLLPRLLASPHIMGRLCQRSRETPQLDSAAKCAAVNSKLSCPVSTDHLASIVLYPDIPPRVSGLFRIRRPLAVAWAVSGAVVDALDGRFRWPVAHVGREGKERLSPAVAHGYSACSIIAILLVCLSMAASNHRLPDVVNRRVCLAVPFPAKTPAPQRLAPSERIATNVCGSPAIANTSPCWFAKADAFIRLNCQEPEALPFQPDKRPCVVHAPIRTRSEAYG
jgi:hypothetical protein